MADNTPRRDNATSVIDSRHFYPTELGGPAKSFQHDVVEALVYDKCCQHKKYRAQGGKFMLINAWNEWGEGMALEPSNVYGRGLLESVRSAKKLSNFIGCDMQKMLHYRKKNRY